MKKFPSFPSPLVSVDIIIFSVFDDALQVLLAQRPDATTEPYPSHYCLPGGYVNIDIDVDLQATAIRKLQEKTGYTASYLEQLACWGSSDRDPRGWSVTQAYFALLPVQSKEKREGQIWMPVDKVSELTLAFDHNDIFMTALKRLRSQVEITSLPAFLLTEPFTLPQLQRTYEVVLARNLDKSAFRKRCLDTVFLVEGDKINGGYGRSAIGYKLVQRDTAITFPRPFKSGEVGE